MATWAAWVVPILHPAALFRGRWAEEPEQWEWLRRARRLHDGEWEPPTLEELVEGAPQEPTLADLQEWERVLRTQPQGLHTLDIECAGPHLVFVGLCRVADLAPIGVRFRRQGGGLAHSPEELRPLVEWLARVLADPTLQVWGHNAQAFDIPYLEHLGFEVGGFAGDTMLLQRYLYPGLQANLEHVAAFHAELPGWKWLVHNKDEEEEGK